MRAPLTRILAVGWLLVGLSACNILQKDAGTKAVAAVNVSHPEIRLAPGEKIHLRARVTDESGNVLKGIRITWSSSDKAFGVVDPHGRVTAVNDSGSFNITASVGGVSSSARAVIIPPDETCLPPRADEPPEAGFFDLQLLQSIEVTSGDVPTITGRPMIVRASLVAQSGHPLRLPASVHIHVSRNGTQLGRLEAIGPDCIPATPRLAQLEATFNAVIPADWVKGRLEVFATATVENGAEENAQVLRFPASGTIPLDVVTPPPFEIMFVPLELTLQGQATSLDESQLDDALLYTRSLWPLDQVEATIRSTVLPVRTTDPYSILPVLGELRLLEDSQALYHGLVPGGLFEGGPAGIGVFGRPLSWSSMSEHESIPGVWFPNGGTIAHEIGHNFDRRHAKCGEIPGGIGDPHYPYQGGIIGTYGINWLGIEDFDRLVLPETADRMSYCWPGWISDHNYKAAYEFRRQEAKTASFETASIADVVLVSGEIRADGVTLRPAFSLRAVPRPPEPGAWSWRLLDSEGEILASSTFTPMEATSEDGRIPVGFAFTLAVPPDAQHRARTAQILDPDGQVRTRTGAESPGMTTLATTSLRAERMVSGEVRLTWDSEHYPAAVVREPGNTAILTRGENGEMMVRTNLETLEVLLSNGLTSFTYELMIQ